MSKGELYEKTLKAFEKEGWIVLKETGRCTIYPPKDIVLQTEFVVRIELDLETIEDGIAKLTQQTGTLPILKKVLSHILNRNPYVKIDLTI